MASRYKTTFKFFDTAEEAQNFCDIENKNSYIKKHHPAHFTTWTSQNGKENKFVAWYML